MGDEAHSDKTRNHMLMFSSLFSMDKTGRSVLFIGNDPAVAGMYRRLAANPSSGYTVRGYYADNDITDTPPGLQRIGDMAQLDEVMARTADNVIRGGHHRVDIAVCCLPAEDSETVRKIMDYCDRNVIRCYWLPCGDGEQPFRLVPCRFLDTAVYTARPEPLSRASNRRLKRAFDIAMSSVVCLCTMPLLPLVALLVKIQSPGPIFFRQDRTGQDGRTFRCLKFRSLHVNRDADRVQTTKDDPRKFPFGSFMRRTNIDELPQFLNVLRGDMSIVGPRPHMLYHTEMYGQLIDKYMVRHFLKPGITGWAQVTGFRGETPELWQMEGRIRRDIWYIEHWSLWLDVKIVLMTVRSMVFPDRHAY